MNENMRKKDNLEGEGKSLLERSYEFFPPVLDDGSIAWQSPFHWTAMHSDTNYSNFLRGVVTHFAYMIIMKGSRDHRIHCPAVLVERAQRALNGVNDPRTSRHSYRLLWEALGLRKGDTLPSSNK